MLSITPLHQQDVLASRLSNAAHEVRSHSRPSRVLGAQNHNACLGQVLCVRLLQGLLHIVRGWHPLVEALATSHHSFVPNSTETGLDSENSGGHRVLVVTGVNLSAKSLYQKHVGLIAFMARIGSCVQADKAEMGLCEFIFSCIQRCSTSTHDLCQLSRAVKHATAASSGIFSGAHR